MKSIRVIFEDLGVDVLLHPATNENEAYTEYLREAVQPHQLALTLDRFSEKAAVGLLADVYAKTVVAEYGNLDEEAWRQWFLEHPLQFNQIAEIAENPDLWEDWCHG